MAERLLRIAATADLHYGKHSRGTLHDAFAEISRSADILLLCGDLTDYGLPEEAEELVADIRAAVRIPVLAVMGNHDFESSQPENISKVLDGAGVNVLNGEAIERSEEHTSELQSRSDLVCRLLLEKKKKAQQHIQ